MWPWVATRWLRNGITIWKLSKKSINDMQVDIKELIEPFNPSFLPNSNNINKEISEYKSILDELIQDWIIEIVDDDFASNMYINWKKLLIEWAQSDGLWMYGWAYPFNTSTDTSFLWVLSSAWIVPTPERVWEILVTKVLPTAVWNHIFPERVSNVYPSLSEKETNFWMKTGEFWATTGRSRMIGLPSPDKIAEYIKKDPYVIAVSLRKLDVLENFKNIINFNKLPIINWYNKKWEPNIIHSKYNAQEIVQIYKDTINNIVWNNKWDKLPFILWFGPKPKKF